MKGTQRNEDSLRDLSDSIRHPNIQIISVPEEEEKKEYEKFFEEMIVRNVLNLGKEIVN